MAKNAREARRALGGVTPAEVAAWDALDLDTAIRLRRRVRIAVRRIGSDRRDEVESLAMGRAARFHAVTGGNVDRAAALAVRSAEMTVGQAYASFDLLAEWDTADESMTETYERLAARAGITRQWTTDPAARSTSRLADVLAAIAPAGPLADAFTAYCEHAAGCDTCDAPTTARIGRRPSLAGIVAHVNGWTGDDSRYHRSRRDVLAALKDVTADDVDRALDEILNVRPGPHARPHGRSRASWRNNGRPTSITVDPWGRPAPAPTPAPTPAVLPDTDRLTVRTADGRTFVDSHKRLQERAAERLADLSDDERAAVLADRAAGERAASFVPAAARKPGRTSGRGGSGATGPVVPARLS